MIAAVRALRAAGGRVRSAWENAVGGAFLVGLVVDLETRRRVRKLEGRVQVLELERWPTRAETEPDA